MISPVGDRVIVQEIQRRTHSRGGLVLPENRKEDTNQEAIVIAVGPGPSIADNGKVLTPIEVKPGDHILFTRYGRSPFEHGGVKYVTIRKHNIYALIDCSQPHEIVANHDCEMRGKLDHARQPTIADEYKG